jgi:hypothetical protein
MRSQHEKPEQVVNVIIIQSMQKPTSHSTSNLISREPKRNRREIKSECLFGVVKYINYEHTRISDFFWCPRPKLIIPCCNVGTKRSRWARETVHKMKRRCGAVEWVGWIFFVVRSPSSTNPSPIIRNGMHGSKVVD